MTDQLRLMVEILGYRREGAKENTSTMQTSWVPDMNTTGTHARWEFTEVYTIDCDFAATVAGRFATMVGRAAGTGS